MTTRWYGKFFGAIAGALLMRHPAGALIGLLIGHAFDSDWFAPQKGQPYRVLGIAEDASDADVEQAWRKLMSQYHPDRIAGAAPELQRQADARAREINAAYDRIRKERKK